MHDIRFIREQPDLFDQSLSRRGLPHLSAEILEIDRSWRHCQTQLQDAQAQRNQASKSIGAAKKSGDDEEATRLMAAVSKLKELMAELEDKSQALETRLRDKLLQIPNRLAQSVPDGADEDDNVECHRFKEPVWKKSERDHVDIAGHYLDFESAARISGARFAYLRGPLARLERALGAFMLDENISEYGYMEVATPSLVRDQSLIGTGQLPKFEDDLFQTTDGRWLIPTAEVTLTNLVQDRIIMGEELPMRFTAWTPCYRAEAGSAGRDTRGLIRMHQFAKVELVSITTPDTSEIEHERMLEASESLLRKLDLPYRTMLLCSGDTGFSANKTYDIEVWIPSQETYREISSVSNCGDFQARRMNARMRTHAESSPIPVHTLNGSALALGRTMVAIMENYQLEQGGFAIPEILWPYMGGLKEIRW